MNYVTLRNIAAWAGLFFLCALAYNFFWPEDNGALKLNFSQFISVLNDNQVKSVSIQGRYLEGELADSKLFYTYLPEYPGLIEELRARGVDISVVPLDSKSGSLLGTLFPYLLILAFPLLSYLAMRFMPGAGAKGFGFGRSKAKLSSERPKVTFDEVAGVEEAKAELFELVEFLRDPAKFGRLGGKVPKGCLLMGRPGTGKTLLAKAVAGEASVPFFSISGSEFVEMFVGVGASRVRDMFETAKKQAPCIIFIDEIDAVGRHRGGVAGFGGANDEREQTLNQILVEMDGFESNLGVIVIAATNRADVLDSALLRPGRFDRRILVPLPDVDGREKILRVHLADVQHDANIDVRAIARGTPGFTGAELASLVNEAALLASKKEKECVGDAEMDFARDKLIMGLELKSKRLSEEERRLTAYHEGGHAIVSLYVGESDPIHKITIIPHDNTLGMVVRLPERDCYSITKSRLESELSIALGGRIAEELIFGPEKITSGASSDIQSATLRAKDMVVKWGMTESVGLVHVPLDSQEATMYGGRYKLCSEHMFELVDREVRNMIDTAYARAKIVIEGHIEELHIIAKALLEHEVLTGDQVKELLAKPKLVLPEESPEVLSSNQSAVNTG